MTGRPFLPSRRHFLAGTGAAMMWPTASLAQQPQIQPKSFVLRAAPLTIPLRPGQPETGISGLIAEGTGAVPTFARGDEVAVTFRNDLPIPVALNWHGLDGNPAAEPLTGRPFLAAGGSETFKVAFRHAGTLMCDARLSGDGHAQPSAVCAVVVREREPVATDGDEVVLIEDWRLRADGSPAALDANTEAAEPLYTVNGKATLDFTRRQNERVRFRFINGCQRNVIALKVENHDVRVMAIDGQPAEPFLARSGQIILAPGSRIDAFVDATAAPGSTSSIFLHDGTRQQTIARLLTSTEAPLRNGPLSPPPPLPTNGLPIKIDLKNALRAELPLDGAPGAQPGWVTPATFGTAQPAAFRVKRNRPVVIALTNRATRPVTFHLHGHHFRLLDRLDDGWKPFWLDTLVIDAGQTQRIAFVAEHAGLWLMETMAADWAAPRLVRTYAVE
jgi:FtsP/CotA-like multicopper oxidase with cupredoxin domain